MTFSARLKKYLCEKTEIDIGFKRSKQKPKPKSSINAFLRCVFLFLAKKTKKGVVLRSDNSDLLQICAYLLIRFYGCEANVIKTSDTPDRYRLEIEGESAREVLICFGYDEKTETIPFPDFVCDDDYEMFVRAAFLCCGTVLDPSLGYHLELYPNEKYAYMLLELFYGRGFAIKESVRKGRQVLYFKESEKIEDFLTFMGAQNFAMEFMQEKMMKELRNNINRLNNSNYANLDKTISFAQSVIDAINIIRKKNEFENLPENLKETALLREEYPQVSLSELCRLSKKPITKSGLKHRMEKLTLIAGGLSDE